MAAEPNVISKRERFKNLVCGVYFAWLALFGGATVFLTLSLLSLLFIDVRTPAFYVSVVNVAISLFLIVNSLSIIYVCRGRS